MELVEPTAINTKKNNITKDLKESLQILQTWFSESDFVSGKFTKNSKPLSETSFFLLKNLSS